MSLTSVTESRIHFSNPEDVSDLLESNASVRPVEVKKSLPVNDQTVTSSTAESEEQTCCIDSNCLLYKKDLKDVKKKMELTTCTDSTCKLYNVDLVAYKKQLEYHSYMMKLSLDKVDPIFLSAMLQEELQNEVQQEESINPYFDKDLIQEAVNQKLLPELIESILQPLIIYFEEEECLICGRFLEQPTEDEIKAHMMSHISRGSYYCSSCENKFFPTTHTLFSHSVLHTDGNEYSCVICKEGFRRNYFLSLHSNMEHPVPYYAEDFVEQIVPTYFNCSYCKMKVTSWRMIRNHKDVHSGKESYRCAFCKKTFTVPYLLRYHRHCRLTSKPHLCKSCPKNFKTLKEVRKHEKKVHSRKVKLNCKFCVKKKQRPN